MADVKITRAPKKALYLTTPVASGWKFSTSWKNDPYNTDSNSPCRAEITVVHWTVTCEPAKYTKDYEWWESGSATSSTLDLEALLGGDAYFLPRGKAALLKVTVRVAAGNGKGMAKAASASCAMYAPSKPVVDPLSLGADGVASCDVSCKEENDRQKLTSVEHYIRAYDSSLKRMLFDKRGTTPKGSAGSIEVAGDVLNYAALADEPSRVVAVRAGARARGPRGDSGWAERLMYVSVPGRPSITAVSSPSPKFDEGLVVRFKVPDSGGHPFTGCRLQVLRNVTETVASKAYAMDGWEYCGAEDNGACTALYARVQDLLPDVDRVTWVRVKAWNLVEDTLYSCSVPRRLTSLERTSPNPGAVVLAPLEAGGDGTSLMAHLYWNDDGNTATQVDWADDGYAWASTEAPSTFTVTRDDGRATYMAVDGTSTEYAHHTDLYIRGLEAGRRYWVKARRFVEREDGTAYGRWSDKLSAIVGAPPDSVTLSAPSRVPRESPIPVTWAISAPEETLPRMAWMIVLGSTAVVDPQLTNMQHIVLLDSEDGSRNAIPWSAVERALEYQERLGSLVYKAGRPSDIASIDICMAAGIKGGRYTVSRPVTVAIRNDPEVALVLGEVTQQPATITVRASEELSAIDVVVRSRGAFGELPEGELVQEPGHCVWAAQVTSWVEADDATEDLPFAYDVEMPWRSTLVDGATYDVSIRGWSLTDPGVSSNRAEGSFHVSWSHQAPAPGACTVEPSVVTDEDGARSVTASITVVAGDGALASDVYDVYRVTPDRAELVAEGAPAGSVVVDRYAPYGDAALAYRVATRTLDGDLCWADYPYDLRLSDMRIDFANSYVELPYNLSLADAYEKDFESRAHLGGGSPQGYWNEGVSRRASLDAELVRLDSPETETRLRDLARHAGPCFVRLPDGSAYEANVEVRDISGTARDATLSVSLEATEVSPSGTYLAEVTDGLV